MTVMMNLLAVKLEPFNPIEYVFYNSSGVLFLQVMLYIKAFKTDKFCTQKYYYRAWAVQNEWKIRHNVLNMLLFMNT